MKNKIGVVIIGVKDMDRAVRFYQRAIGLPLKFKSPTYSEFKTRGAVLALEKRELVPIQTGPAFATATDDIRKDYARLRKKRVRFYRRPYEEPFGLIMLAADPDGNIFEIVQYGRKREQPHEEARRKEKARGSARGTFVSRVSRGFC